MCLHCCITDCSSWRKGSPPYRAFYQFKSNLIKASITIFRCSFGKCNLTSSLSSKKLDLPSVEFVIFSRTVQNKTQIPDCRLTIQGKETYNVSGSNVERSMNLFFFFNTYLYYTYSECTDTCVCELRSLAVRFFFRWLNQWWLKWEKHKSGTTSHLLALHICQHKIVKYAGKFQ